MKTQDESGIDLYDELKIWQTVLKKLPQLSYAGDEVLQTPCRLITPEDFSSGRVTKWFDLMRNTLKTYRQITGFGRGLAANQVGINTQIIVTYVDDAFRAYINPTIIEQSEDKAVYGELCISLGLLMGDIVRPVEVTVESLDVYGKKQQEHAMGIMSRLLQHEIAHLRGQLCLDEAMPASLRIIRHGQAEVFGQKLKLLREMRVEI
ncbi:peptide deformylase [Candidatus Gottesmanbacteria bacterium]|nr:peptide deformylase [Candidatus Gottesmanbacteria bacterium]